MNGAVRLPNRTSWPFAFATQQSAQVTRRVTQPVVADITPPVTVYVSETASKVSTVTGFATTTVSWTVDEDCQAWQIRDVTGTGETVADGVLVASGGAVSANASQTTAIAGASLGASDGLKTLKIFAQDLAGNWTT